MAPRKQITTPPSTSRPLRSTFTTNGSIQKPASSTSYPTSRTLRPRKPSTRAHEPKQKSPKSPPSSLQPVPTPKTTTGPSVLETIPLELLLEIYSHLKPPSQICLTLTCKSILRLLGNSSWSRCRVGEHCYFSWESNGFTEQEQARVDRKVLLDQLSADTTYAPLTYCALCNILHPPFQPPQTHKITKGTHTCFRYQNGVIDYLPFSHNYKTGYSLVWQHIKNAFDSQEFNSHTRRKIVDIPYLSGEFENRTPQISYNLVSSAKRIHQNLILKHEHGFTFFPEKDNNKQINPLEALGLPIRICPHQSTSTSPPHDRWFDPNSTKRRSKSRKGKEDLNSPLFSHSILGAFPLEKLIGDSTLKAGEYMSARARYFRKPTPSEQKEIDLINAGKRGLVFSCRSCPTRWKVDYDDDDEKRQAQLRVTAWHCFYGNAWSSFRIWPSFVRREAETLGKSTRNSEYYASQKRTIREFQIE
ncbi:hypothetical protein QBC44DRAFT_248915 [Cladorrhinum sp. PSN332]|nr:hypothetical protein QBC44DRAFT_248915 [Cladorrhinum sp. PSN332]